MLVSDAFALAGNRILASSCLWGEKFNALGSTCSLLNFRLLFLFLDCSTRSCLHAMSSINSNDGGEKSSGAGVVHSGGWGCCQPKINFLFAGENGEKMDDICSAHMDVLGPQWA